MHSETRRGRPVPPQWLVADVLGALLLAAGVIGLAGGTSFVPALADPQVAWSLVAVGTGLMAIAAVKIVAALRARR